MTQTDHSRILRWLHHTTHLAEGHTYMKDCWVCELQGSLVDPGVDADVRRLNQWYRVQQRSGKKSATL